MTATLNTADVTPMSWLEGVVDELFERHLEKQIEDGDLDGRVDPDTKKPYEPHKFMKWTGKQEIGLGRSCLELEFWDVEIGRPSALWLIVDFREGTVYLNWKGGTIGEARMLHTKPLVR